MNTTYYLPKLKQHFGGTIVGNALITKCLLCGKDRHFYIYANPTGLNSRCFKCGFKLIKYSDYLSDYSFIPTDIVSGGFVARTIVKTSDIPKALTIDDDGFKPAYDYLISRGIREATIRKYNLSLGLEFPWEGRVLFYVLDDYGAVLLVGGRSIDSNTNPRYYYGEGSPKSRYLFNINHIEDIYDYVVIMEGAFDVICSGIPNAVALLGSTISDDQMNQLVTRFKNFVVWLDSPNKDKEAWHKANVIANKLIGWGGVKIVNQKHGSDPGDCPDPVRELTLCSKDYGELDWGLYNASRRL